MRRDSIVWGGWVCVVWLSASQGAWAQPAFAPRDPSRQELRGFVRSVDVAGSAITVQLGAGRGPGEERTLKIAPQAEIVAGGPLSRLGVFQPAKLDELSAGHLVTLALAANGQVVDSIVAEGRTIRGELLSVDAANRTVTLQVPATRDRDQESRTITVANTAEITIDETRNGRTSQRDTRLDALKPGAFVNLRLSLDDKQATSLSAEGPALFGVVQSATNQSLTLLVRTLRDGAMPTERTLTVSPDAVVLTDDGKGRRLSVKVSTAGEIPPGSLVSARLGADDSIVFLRAEGPSLNGQLRSIDAAKGNVTIAVFRNRGEDPEEKTYAVTADTRITTEGANVKLADLKLGPNGAFAQFRLTLDQKAIQSLVVRQIER